MHNSTKRRGNVCILNCRQFKKQQWVEYRSEVTAFELRNNQLSGSAAQQTSGRRSGTYEEINSRTKNACWVTGPGRGIGARPGGGFVPDGRTLRTCCAVLAAGLIWSGCSSEPEPAAKRASPTTAQQKPRPSATPSPTGMDFIPDPGRAPKTAADGVRLGHFAAEFKKRFGVMRVERYAVEAYDALLLVPRV
jgi:hypothetical protein